MSEYISLADRYSYGMLYWPKLKEELQGSDDFKINELVDLAKRLRKTIQAMELCMQRYNNYGRTVSWLWKVFPNEIGVLEDYDPKYDLVAIRKKAELVEKEKPVDEFQEYLKNSTVLE